MIDQMFLEILQGLPVKTLAHLRRCASALPELDPDIGIHLMPHLSTEMDNAQTLAAMLWPHHRAHSDEVGNLAESFQRYLAAVPGERKHIETRFMGLLDGERDHDLARQLYWAVRKLAQENLTINWLTLLWDLREWPDPTRIAQKRWARAFWG